MLGSMLGGVFIVAILYQIFRMLLSKIIVIETHRMFISAVLAGVTGEVLWYFINSYFSLLYLLGALIVYFIALINYNLKIKNRNNGIARDFKQNSISAYDITEKLFIIALNDSNKIFEELVKRNIVSDKINRLTKSEEGNISLELMTLILAGYLYKFEEIFKPRLFELMKQNLFLHIDKFCNEVGSIELKHTMINNTIEHLNGLKSKNYYHMNIFIDSWPFDITNEDLKSLAVFWDYQFSEYLTYCENIRTKYSIVT